MKKRRLLAGLLAVWPYLFGIVALLGEWEEGVVGFLALYMGLTAAVYILSAVNAWTWPAQGYRELESWNLAAKLIHIPFYVCVFLIGLVMAGAMAVPALLFVSPMIIAMLWVVDILLMVTSSMYGAAGAVRARQSGRMRTGRAAVLTVMSFLFVLDVIAAILLRVMVRKTKGEKRNG